VRYRTLLSLLGAVAGCATGAHTRFVPRGVAGCATIIDVAPRDGASIEAALLRAADSTGVCIHLERGVHRLRRPIRVEARVRFIGDGQESIVRMDPDEQGAVPKALFVVAHDDVEFSDLLFEGNARPSTFYDRDGAHTNEEGRQFAIIASPGTSGTARRGAVRRCHFGSRDGAFGRDLGGGIKLDEPTLADGTRGSRTEGWRVIGNTFQHLRGSADGAGYGILVGGSSGGVFSDNRFVGFTGGSPTANHGRHAVYLAGGASRNLVAHNLVSGFNEAAFAIYARGHQPSCDFNRIVDNFIVDPAKTSGNSGAIGVEGRSRFNLIGGNTIVNAGLHGIGLIAQGESSYSLVGNIVVGNTIVRPRGAGIMLVGASASHVIDNHVQDASFASLGAHSAIAIFHTNTSLAEDNEISGNLVDGTTPSGWRAAVYINGTAGKAPLRTMVSHNRLSPGILGVLVAEGPDDVFEARPL